MVIPDENVSNLTATIPRATATDVIGTAPGVEGSGTTL